MSSFSTPAILLRKIDFRDYDIIVTFYSLTRGKISVVAKYAKKSAKRFSGMLELFSVLKLVCTDGKGKSLPILKEASLDNPFSTIRSDIKKTAYASYWAEIIYQWTEKNVPHIHLYYLLKNILEELDAGQVSKEVLSIFFQIRFLALSGFNPNLNYCCQCRLKLDELKAKTVHFDLARGGVVCHKCGSVRTSDIILSKRTLKHLIWINHSDLKMVKRIRFTADSIREGLLFLETFVPYNLGKIPRSLKFLRRLRD